MSPPSAQIPLYIKNLTKTFGHKTVVAAVSLKLLPGEIYALVGPNGAGKTTLLKMIAGLLQPTSGEVRIFGHDINTESVAAKKTFAYISDDPVPYEFLTGEEFLRLTGALRDLPDTQTEKRIRELTHLFPLDQLLGEPITSYSRGNKQKIAFLSAILTQPQMLLIDEPIVGLDPVSIKIFGKSLKLFTQKQGPVLFATHSLSFAQNFANRCAVMHQGKILVEKKLDREVNLEQLYQKTLE